MDLDTFWRYVEKDGPNGCWLWLASVQPNGYARSPVPPDWNAHRVAYRALVGDIPDGMQIDHLCRVRHCCNPAHLELVTPAENTRRGLSPAQIVANSRARAARRTHCPQGHPYAGKNLHINRAGKRVCRACHNAASRRSAQRKKAVA